jgi:hypothetical protein
VGVVVVALLGALWALGTAGGEEGDRSAGQDTVPQETSGGGEEQPEDDSGEGGGDEGAGDEEEPEEVRLRLEATGPVYVCLADDDGILVRGDELAAGEETDDFEAGRFRMILGNNEVDMIINGERRSVPSSQDRILLELTPSQGRQPLPESSAPDCT